ncbi:MAG TPA: MmgE/PrpD family protein [Casimicrobiaceae bacterium]|nr:MmgE/PrpD family protein [Casimicrobiaceae bacterium]
MSDAAPAVTPALARFARVTPRSAIPAAVRHEALRALVNWTGCAVGAARHPSVERALAALAPFSGPAQATVLGRTERVDILHAALVNGIASHTFDFDDTHLRTVIHPAGPVAAAILALAEYRPVDGRTFIDAFVIGVEVECRIGNAVYPSHYDVGWHITGTAGVFGAAAAAGRLLGLTEQQMAWALGIAATTASGLREMFGSMCKPFHPGWAAKNGLTAALLAQQDFTSAAQPIEGKRGFANVLATARNYAEITERLGETWELAQNTYKPFACGIVIHPVIDGCIELRTAHGLKAGDIESIDVDVHPLVLELTGKKTPQAGLEGKFSVYHSAAVAIIDGAAGETQYSDARVRDPQVIALRDRVHAKVDAALHEDAGRIRITLRDGRVLERFVEHAIGSLARPLTDAGLEDKFRGLVIPVLGAPAAARLLDALWQLDASADVAALPLLCVPAEATRERSTQRAD